MSKFGQTQRAIYGQIHVALTPVKKSFLSSLSSFAKVVIFQNNIKQDDVLLADDIEIYGVTIEQIRSIAFIPHD